jgi:hypothetical protein
MGIIYKSSKLLARNYYYLLALGKSLTSNKGEGTTSKDNKGDKPSKLIII